MRRRQLIPILAFVVLGVTVILPGCGGGTTDPCGGVDCGGAGDCRLTPFDNAPYCACWPGYHPTAGDLACAPNDPGDPCLGVVCSGHGTCVATGPVPVCECDVGYERDLSGLYCFSTTPPPSDADADIPPDSSPDADVHFDSDADVPPSWWRDQPVREPGLTKLDIVFLVDNSGSMAQEQVALASRFPELLAELLDPPDRDGDTRPDHAAVEDLNIGVISPDMGTGGYTVPTCTNRDIGDNGCFRHSPSGSVPGCAATYPAFLARNETNADIYTPTMMAQDLTCIATLGTGGCGFEQPLKAMRAAMKDNIETGTCNTGFLRDDSLLALIWVTDEEDCSVRPDHTEMFDPGRAADLGHLNLRCYRNPDYVVSVEDYDHAFRSLRPTGSANVFLAMIVGVPPDVDQCIGFGDSLGACLTVTAMMEAIDPAFPTQLIPSCNTSMGMAYPPRRFVTLAQAWGKDAYVDSICKTDWTPAFAVIGGRLVESLRDDYVCLDGAPPFDGGTCSVGCWMIETRSGDSECWGDSSCPQAWCPPATAETVNRLEPCRDPASGAECVPLARDLGVTTAYGYPRRQCLLRQVPRDPAALRCGAPLGAGWYFVPDEWSVHFCPEIAFTRAGVGPWFGLDSRVELRCPR